MKKIRAILATIIFVFSVPCVLAQQIIEVESDDDDDYSSDYDSDYDSSSDDYYDDYNDVPEEYADYDADDYSYTPPCAHSGNITGYSIVRYREGMASWEKPVTTTGHVLVSGRCLTIECPHLNMAFTIGRKETLSTTPRFIRYHREQPDEVCDVIELREAFGRDAGLYYLMMGRLNEAGYMIGTMQVTMKPMKVVVK